MLEFLFSCVTLFISYALWNIMASKYKKNRFFFIIEVVINKTWQQALK